MNLMTVLKNALLSKIALTIAMKYFKMPQIDALAWVLVLKAVHVMLVIIVIHLLCISVRKVLVVILGAMEVRILRLISFLLMDISSKALDL